MCPGPESFCEDPGKAELAKIQRHPHEVFPPQRLTLFPCPTHLGHTLRVTNKPAKMQTVALFGNQGTVSAAAAATQGCAHSEAS
jgi:hypothetical protein